MTEADDVAARLPLPAWTEDEQDLRDYVRAYMPGESAQVIDNVAEALADRMRLAYDKE